MIILFSYTYTKSILRLFLCITLAVLLACWHQEAFPSYAFSNNSSTDFDTILNELEGLKKRATLNGQIGDAEARAEELKKLQQLAEKADSDGRLAQKSLDDSKKGPQEAMLSQAIAPSQAAEESNRKLEIMTRIQKARAAKMKQAGSASPAAVSLDKIKVNSAAPGNEISPMKVMSPAKKNHPNTEKNKQNNKQMIKTKNRIPMSSKAVSIDKVRSDETVQIHSDDNVTEGEVDLPQAIHPGDTLNITVDKEPDLSGVFTVPSSGMLVYPLIGKIKFSGRTVEKLKGEMTEALKKFLVKPQITIFLETRQKEEMGASEIMHTITVLGETIKPGSYQLQPDAKLTDLIARSGGLSPYADEAHIKIVRVGEEGPYSLQINLEDIKRKKIEDPYLHHLDKVIIPEEEAAVDTVAILGEVAHPGVYKITQGLTLVRLVAKAGGLNGLSDPKKIRIIHTEDDEEFIYVHNLNSILNGNKIDPKISVADKVYVPEAFF